MQGRISLNILSLTWRRNLVNILANLGGKAPGQERVVEKVKRTTASAAVTNTMMMCMCGGPPGVIGAA
jgi:hypothetical protein